MQKTSVGRSLAVITRFLIGLTTSERRSWSACLNEWKTGMRARVCSKQNEWINVSLRALSICLFAQHIHGTNSVTPMKHIKGKKKKHLVHCLLKHYNQHGWRMKADFYTNWTFVQVHTSSWLAQGVATCKWPQGSSSRMRERESAF